MDIVKKWWWAGCILMVVVMFVIDTRATGETVKKMETAFAQIAQIANSAKDPNKLLYDYLILHNIDTVVAKAWSMMPKGALTDKSGEPIIGVSFLDRSKLPERGIMKMYIEEDSIISVRELWSFPLKGEE